MQIFEEEFALPTHIISDITTLAGFTLFTSVDILHVKQAERCQGWSRAKSGAVHNIWTPDLASGHRTSLKRQLSAITFTTGAAWEHGNHLWNSTCNHRVLLQQRNRLESSPKKSQIAVGKADHIWEMAMRVLNVTGEQIEFNLSTQMFKDLGSFINNNILHPEYLTKYLFLMTLHNSYYIILDSGFFSISS